MKTSLNLPQNKDAFAERVTIEYEHFFIEKNLKVSVFLESFPQKNILDNIVRARFGFQEICRQNFVLFCRIISL